MKRLMTTDGNILRQNTGKGGFSLLGGLVLVLLAAFIAAAAMGMLRIRYALLGFVVAVIVALIIATIPDLKRYMKISSM